MTTYILYFKLTESKYTEKPNWDLLSKQYGFKIIKETPTIATIETSEETIDSLKKQYPEIHVTDEKKYYMR